MITEAIHRLPLKSEDGKIQITNTLSKKSSSKANQIKKKSLIKINTNQCRGELKLIRELIKSNKWEECFHENKSDIYWGARLLPEDEHIALKIPVNRIPGANDLCEKKYTAYIIKLFQSYYEENFDFFPSSYLFPENFSSLKKIFANQKKSNISFIAKPTVGSEGNGIRFIKDISDLNSLYESQINNEYVIQEYLSNPLLIENKKFDLRIYVLQTSTDPLIIYLNEEGLTRICTEPYQKPNSKNIKNPYMHLSNYSLNKNSKNYKYTEDIDSITDGNKTTLASLWKMLQNQVNDEGIFEVKKSKLMEGIKAIIKNSLIAMQPFLLSRLKQSFGDQLHKCFQLFGFDIMIDSDWKPWLIEINNNPSLNIGFDPYCKIEVAISKVDYHVKEKVVGDAIRLIHHKSIKEQCQNSIGFKYRSWELIHSSAQNDTNMDIFKSILDIFQQINLKHSSTISSSNFRKLAELQGMTNEKFTKADYDIMFNNSPIRKCLTYSKFIWALENIMTKLNIADVNNSTQEDKKRGMSHLLDLIRNKLK